MVIPGAGPVVNPFAPATMTIHPLTRIDKDPAGKMWIYCHIEFKDSWGDTVKATGKLDIQLFRPTGGSTSVLGTQELVWKVDLSDLEKNASLYDPATRTYRLPLENPPAWLAQPSADADAPRARLKAVFSTPGARNGTWMLEDEFALVG